MESPPNTKGGGLVKNRKLSQTARGGQASTSGGLLNAQLSLGEEEEWGCGKTPPPHKGTGTASLSLPFLFPLRPTKGSMREEIHLPAPTPRPGHSQHLSPLSSEGKVVSDTHTHVHTNTYTRVCTLAHSGHCVAITLGVARLLIPQAPRKHQEVGP